MDWISLILSISYFKLNTSNSLHISESNLFQETLQLYAAIMVAESESFWRNFGKNKK